MIITKEVIDILAPKHGRTSCSDENLSNAYGGWTGKYDVDTGRKKIIYPRCNRCYLIDNIGMEMDNIEFKFELFISHKEDL